MAYVAEPEAEILPREEVADLQIEAIPGRKHALVGVRNAMQMVMRVRTPKVEEAETRPPLHVACVMDCSGSMGGQKIAFAKKAVCKLVKHLTLNDTLHFITYDSDARVVFQNGDLSDAGKETLRAQIEAIRTQGQTNLCAGLELAATLLEASTETRPSGMASLLPTKWTSTSQSAATADTCLRRIFLFSDGRVNRGVTDPQAIRNKVASFANQGIITGAFGIGADFDEPLMRGIATSGQGRYQFLATAPDIPKLVSKSLHQLIDMYASDAMLEIRGYEHTVVTKVYGSHEEEADERGMASTPGLLNIGDLHSDNVRAVLVEVDVAPPGNANVEEHFDAVEWIFTCQRKGSTVRFSGRVQLMPTQDRACLQVVAPTVQIAFAIRRATDLEREVAELLSHRDRTKARLVKAQQMAIVEEALEVGQRQQDEHGDVGTDLELLKALLERARQVAERLDDENVDEELMARQCWQDRDDFSCASLCRMVDRANSSASGEDVGDVRDLVGLSPASSPRGSPRCFSPRCTSPTGSQISSRSSSPDPTPDRQRSRTPPSPPAGAEGSSPAATRNSISDRMSSLWRRSGNWFN